MDVLGICLWLAASATNVAPVFLPANGFTLAWVHSIERVRWEEDYAVLRAAQPGQPSRLLAGRARIKGSAAGMEPPPDAVWQDGWYGYQAPQAPTEGLRLMRSEFTTDYEWCNLGRCTPLSAWLPPDGGVTRLQACSAGEVPLVRLRHP